MGNLEEFLERLSGFLARPPGEFRYAVEVRNPEFLEPAFGSARLRQARLILAQGLHAAQRKVGGRSLVPKSTRPKRILTRGKRAGCRPQSLRRAGKRRSHLPVPGNRSHPDPHPRLSRCARHADHVSQPGRGPGVCISRPQDRGAELRTNRFSDAARPKHVQRFGGVLPHPGCPAGLPLLPRLLQQSFGLRDRGRVLPLAREARPDQCTVFPQPNRRRP